MKSTLVLALVASAAPVRAVVGQEVTLPATAPAPGRWSDAVDRSRAAVLAHMHELAIPGGSAAVAVNGRILWAEGFGLADVENGVTVGPHTKMLGSTILLIWPDDGIVVAVLTNLEAARPIAAAREIASAFAAVPR